MSNQSYQKKDKESTRQPFSHSSKNQPSKGAYLQDNRPSAIAQRKLMDGMKNYNPIQKKPNNTGLPDNLKSGIENLSGHSMDDVKVHYNSDKPAQLNAHAYAQGSDIHLGSGQEKHLPHEAWHVVQQKQGRVKPTVQMKGKIHINDDDGLEQEADIMGHKALQLRSNDTISPHESLSSTSFGQNNVVQRKVGFEFQTRIFAKASDGSNLPYQSKLFTTYPKDAVEDFDHSYFELSTDYEKDDSVIEIVTPPAETREELSTIMNKVDLMRKSLFKVTSKGTKETTIEAAVDRYKVETENNDEYNIQTPEAKIGKEGSTWEAQAYTKGQFTFGAKLEYLSALLIQIMSNPKLVRDPAVLKDLKKHIKAARSDINDKKGLFEDNPEAETGLAAITTMYKKGIEIFSGAEPLKYPKGGTVFMARTDFHSMYNQLDDTSQGHWDGFVDRQQDKDHEMFPSGFYLDSSQTESEKGPTYEDWLKSIKSPNDFGLEFADDSVYWQSMINAVKKAGETHEQRVEKVNTSGKDAETQQKAIKSLDHLRNKKLLKQDDFTLLLETLGIAFNPDKIKKAYDTMMANLNKKADKDLMSRGKISNTASSMGSMEVPTEGSDKGMAILENRFMAQPLNDERRGYWHDIILEMYDELQKAIRISKLLSDTGE